LIGSNPARALVGYGPDTMGLVFGPFAPPALGQLEGRWVLPDRAHNAVLDTVVAGGLVGLLAEGLFATLLVVAHCVVRPGWVRRAWRCYLFAAVAAAVAAHVVEVQVDSRPPCRVCCCGCTPG